MNKLLSFICIFSALIMVVFAFSSCQKTQEETLLEMNELDRADELSRLSDIAMSEKTSYKSTMIGEIQTKIQGNRVENEIKSEIAYLFGDTNNFVYQEKYESTVKYRGEETVTTLINGYQNGYMYVYNKTDDITNIFKSPITKSEYLQHMKDMELDGSSLKLDRDGCKAITAQKNDDGTWSVSYSKFTKENLKLLLNDLQNPEQMFDETYEISDVKMVINLMSDFTIKNATMEFEFIENQEENDSALAVSTNDNVASSPVCLIEVSYDYENTLRPMEEIDLSSSKFKQVEDLRYFYNIKNELDNFKSSSEAHATIEMNSSVAYRNQSTVSHETDNITFKNKDGKLEYEIKRTSNGNYYVMSYADGYQDITNELGVVQQHDKKSEIEARVFLESMLDSAGYKIDIISNIEKVADGEYKFTLKPDKSLYESILNVYGGYLQSSSSTLTIKTVDGKIVSYDYSLALSLYLSTVSSSMDIEQNVVCTYEY